MTIEALNNKELISLQSLKAFCKIGDLETAFDEELKSALSAAVHRAEAITGLKLTLGSYKISGYDERRLIAPFYIFSALRVLNGAFTKRGANLYELRGEVEGEALMGFFTDDLIRADERIGRYEEKVAFSMLRTKPHTDYTPEGTPPPIPEDYVPPKTQEQYETDKKGSTAPDNGTPPPIPEDYTPPKSKEQYESDHTPKPKPLKDVSVLRQRLIKAGFLHLPEDIALWLKNYVYTSFKKESWDEKNDGVLKHYRLGNYF